MQGVTPTVHDPVTLSFFIYIVMFSSILILTGPGRVYTYSSQSSDFVILKSIVVFSSILTLTGPGSPADLSFFT